MKPVPVLTMTATVYAPSARLDAADVRIRWGLDGSRLWATTAWRFPCWPLPSWLDDANAPGWIVDKADALRADPDAWRWDIGAAPFGAPSLGAVEVELDALRSPVWAAWCAAVAPLGHRAHDLGAVLAALRASRRVTFRERWEYQIDPAGDAVPFADVPRGLVGRAAAWASGPDVLRARAAIADRDAARLREAAARAEETDQ